MEYNFKVSENATKKLLLSNGFRLIGNDEYSLNHFVYKNLIYIVVKINLKNMEMEWVIKDKNTNSLYIPFYNHDCRGNHLPSIKVIDEFRKTMQELTAKGILEETE